MKTILKSLCIISLLMSATFAKQEKLSGEERAAKFVLIKNAFRTKISADTIAKAYIYIGEKIGTRQASKEKKKGLIKFKQNFSALEKSINDPKLKNLLVYMRFSYEEFLELVNEPYSKDNAQLILDLSSSIGEGAFRIGNQLRDEIGKDPIVFDGLVPNIETIAKYYIAYTAGIKDENTVALMREAVETVAEQIDRRTRFQGNTVKMNKNINKAKYLWDIVYNFYLDIDSNGLPFIVLKTTTDLKKILTKYNFAYIKIRVKKMKTIR